MDCIAHGVAKSRTRLSDFQFLSVFCYNIYYCTGEFQWVSFLLFLFAKYGNVFAKSASVGLMVQGECFSKLFGILRYCFVFLPTRESAYSSTVLLAKCVPSCWTLKGGKGRAEDHAGFKDQLQKQYPSLVNCPHFIGSVSHMAPAELQRWLGNVVFHIFLCACIQVCLLSFKTCVDSAVCMHHNVLITILLIDIWVTFKFVCSSVPKSKEHFPRRRLLGQRICVF